MRLVLSVLSLLAGCAGSAIPSPGPAPLTASEATATESPTAEVEHDEAVDDTFSAQLRSAARGYTRWRKLGHTPSWAPEMCGSPPPGPFPLYSESTAAATHGHKLYFLFAAQSADYLATPRVTQPAGQVIVKEAYAAEPAGDMKDEAVASAYWRASFAGNAMERGGKHWLVGKRRDLFIMLKLAPSTPGTDDGWIYGTVSPTGQVTSAGRVASCMQCHTGKETVDRMFGPADESVGAPGPFERFSTGAKTGGR
jgi:hypothetical protein